MAVPHFRSQFTLLDYSGQSRGPYFSEDKINLMLFVFFNCKSKNNSNNNNS